MRANWTVLLTVVILVRGSRVGPEGQQTDRTKPTVKIIQTIGCVKVGETTWFVTSATDPAETEAPFSRRTVVGSMRTGGPSSPW